MLFESILVWELKIKLVLLWNWFFFGPKSQPFNSETKLFESLLFKDHLYYIIFFAEWSCNIMSTNFTLHVVDLEKYGIKIVFLTNLSCRYVSLNTKKKFKKPLQNTASQLLDIHVLKKWSCATKFQLLNKSWKRQEGAWIILDHFPFKYMKYFKKLSHKKALFCGTNTLNVVNGFVPLFLQKAHTKRYFILAAAD